VLGKRISEAPHWRYGWPIQTLLFLTGITYWIAGVAKLDNGGGIHWATDAVFIEHVANNAFRYIFLLGSESEWTTRLYTMDRRLVAAMAFGSLLLELSAPLMILHRRATLVYGVALFTFHWGVKTIMGITFPYQLSGACFIAFIRWDLVVKNGLAPLFRRVMGLPKPAEPEPAPGPSPNARGIALFITGLLALVLGSPGLRMITSAEKVEDDFLLSNYAMFSKPRPEKHRITWVRATNADGEEKLVPAHYWADGGMNSALAQARRARKSKKKRKRICRRAAQAVAEKKGFDAFDQIEVTTDWYRPEDFFARGDRTPVKRKVNKKCPIRREPTAP
jgi:hypothetical protein